MTQISADARNGTIPSFAFICVHLFIRVHLWRYCICISLRPPRLCGESVLCAIKKTAREEGRGPCGLGGGGNEVWCEGRDRSDSLPDESLPAQALREVVCSVSYRW